MVRWSDELLTLAGEVEIAHFTEASSADVAGPYDVSLVEGSVTTAEDALRILRIREQSRTLIKIGACATSGTAGRRPASQLIPQPIRRPSPASPRLPRRSLAGRHACGQAIDHGHHAVHVASQPDRRLDQVRRQGAGQCDRGIVRGHRHRVGVVQ